MSLQSEQLTYRKPSRDDMDFLSYYHADPVLTRFLPRGRPYQKEEVEEYLNGRLKHWDRHQFGTFIIHRKVDREPVGYVGLEYVSDTEFVDIRYGLTQNAWGKGLALESAKWCLDYGFENTELEQIFGAALPENLPSLAVLEKIGMEQVNNVDFYGDSLLYFAINKS